MGPLYSLKEKIILKKECKKFQSFLLFFLVFSHFSDFKNERTRGTLTGKRKREKEYERERDRSCKRNIKEGLILVGSFFSWTSLVLLHEHATTRTLYQISSGMNSKKEENKIRHVRAFFVLWREREWWKERKNENEFSVRFGHRELFTILFSFFLFSFIARIRAHSLLFWVKRKKRMNKWAITYTVFVCL